MKRAAVRPGAQDKNQASRKRADQDTETEDARWGHRAYKLLRLWLL